MRNLSELVEVRNVFSAVLNSTGAAATTYVGSPIDTLNFADMTAILLLGNPTGTNSAGVHVNVKFQEAATIDATGTSWSDISDGAIMGTVKFDAAALIANTTYLYQDKLYERLDGQERKRYIRPHATITGTAGLVLFNINVALLLGRPRNSEDIVSAVATNTGADSSPQALFYNTY